MKLEQGVSMPVDGSSRFSTTSRDGGAALSSGHDQAWQRAMEQAEFAGWFKDPGEGRQSSGSAAASDSTSASETPPPSRMTTGRSVPMSHYSLFEPTQTSPLRTDSEGETSRAASSRVSVSASPTGYATGGETGYAIREEIAHAAKDDSPQGPVNLGVLISSLVASLRGVSPLAVGSTVDFDVTTTSAVGAMATSRAWPIAPVPLAAISSSEPVSAEDELEEAAASPAPRAQESAANADPNPKIRVHVDWTEEGVRVWLGVDHDAEAALPQVQRQLDRVLAESGSQLLSLVCNGRPVMGPVDGPWAKRTSLAMSPPGPYQQGFQGGDWSAGQPMFHLNEQVEQ